MRDGEDPFPTAKLFMHGRSQAVRLPKAFRMPGKEVRVSKVGDDVVLTPITPRQLDLDAWWARIVALRTEPFPELPEDPPLEPDETVVFD